MLASRERPIPPTMPDSHAAATKIKAMSAEPRPQNVPLKAGASRLGWPQAPLWWLRLRLRWTAQAGTRLEAQLADEFAIAETAPLHAELRDLRAEHDALLSRLVERRR